MCRTAASATLLCAGWLAGAALAAPGSAASAAPDVARALASLDACTARLDRANDIGFARITSRCPDLTRQLHADGIDRWLPASWRDPQNDLSAGSLEELRTLLAHEHDLEAHPAGATPSLTKLRQVLTEIGASAQARSGLWQRLKSWLRNIAAARTEDDEPGWFARMVSRMGLPQTVLELATYAALAVLIALAVLVVLNEARVANLLGRRVSRTRAAADGTLTLQSQISAADVERAPLLERPRLLLELISERLARAPRRLALRSLTVRELIRGAALTDGEDQRRLSELALTTERVRYAADEVTAPELSSAVEAGQLLLEHLSVRTSAPA